MLPAVVLTVLTATVYGYDSCLEQRSFCLRNERCRTIFESFENTCGYSLTRCAVPSPSDCVNDIRKIRDLFPSQTCVCYEAIGFTEQCDYFRQLIWNHPCERRLNDAGIERRLVESQYALGVTAGPQLRRTTRTPLSDQVRQWKSQLSGDLETRERISQGTCDDALNRVCLRHVSCRQLWKLFRSSCGVDQDNQCTMADREVCWQSFEGLTWTGLGSCRCDSNNSDCHWIRLHTNYNKCIYEISKSGQFPLLTSIRSQQSAQQYQRRYESEYQPATQPPRIPFRTPNPTTAMTRWRPTTTTSTTTTSTTTTTTTTTRAPTTSRPPTTTTTTPATTRNPPWWRQTTVRPPTTPEPRKWDRITAQVHYRPLFPSEPKAVTTSPTTYYHYSTATTRTPWWLTPAPPTRPPQVRPTQQSYSRSRSGGSYQADSQTHQRSGASPAGSNSFRRVEFPAEFRQRKPATTSTCQDAIASCEQAEACRWHLGELRVRCTNTMCRRDECASALQRFSRYVPFELVESIMFCQCASNDMACTQQQDLLYPKCLYTSTKPVPTCTNSAHKCQADQRCRYNLHSLSLNCAVSNGECTSTSLDQCRKSLLAARASVLEQPCFCPFSDVECISHQRMMIPNNPCIEKAMLEYSRTHSNTPTNSNLETNRVQHGRQNMETKRGGSYQNTRPNYGNVDRSSGSKYQTTTSTTPPTTTLSWEKQRPMKTVRTRPYKKKYRTTSVPPTTTETPPPWITTTPAPPTTTTTFMTHAPPPPEGCNTRDANGKAIFVHIGTVLRRYVDWSSRCSSWCECVSEDQLVCDRIPCLEEGQCKAPLATVDFGERLFLKDRGACFCESSRFICELPEEMPEMYPGLYISAGYSPPDVALLRKEVPAQVLEKAGFLSSDASKDIASRLQIAFELLLPPAVQCRIVLVPEMSEPGSAFFRVEWFGMNEALNHTKTQWHHGWAEKVCSPYVTQLANMMVEGEALRYQLVLSTVKQIKVLDFLDGLPTSYSRLISIFSIVLVLLLRCF